MTVTEADIEYLRNINTSPGPNAGRSIDPTKPGPDDDEEQTLCKILRTMEPWPCKEAAKTIERLTAEVLALRKNSQLVALRIIHLTKELAHARGELEQ
jgi:hypothetical protein